MFWILFENVMSLHRTKATFIGLLEAGRVNEWVVTEKLGDALKSKLGPKAHKKPRIRIGERYTFLSKFHQSITKYQLQVFDMYYIHTFFCFT